MIKGLDEYLLSIQKHKMPTGINGAIVMNANPFTLGHKFLIDEALKEVNHLYVFVLEEDKSFFSFQDRFYLVKSNCANLQNISIIPSGNYIISSSTFAGYFQKEDYNKNPIGGGVNQYDPTIDLQLFAKRIAPALNISIRFAGSEPYCKVTSNYNEAMRNLLPIYNVSFREIPRISENNQVISATTVRNFIKNKEFDKIKPLVSEITYNFIIEKYG